MKKLLLALAAMTLACASVWSQTNGDVNSAQLIDEGEETITSLQDIIDIQQDLVKREQYSAHIGDVWRHAGFFNIMYHNPGTITLLGTSTSPTPASPKYTAKYGFSIQSGKNHKLHKKPIGRMVSINLDYLPLDLYGNLYMGSDTKLPYGGITSYGSYDYNSDGVPESSGDIDIPTAWDYSLIEVNYSMSIGPSITIAPFVPLKVRGLSFFKFNAYFHVGYAASLMMLKGVSGSGEGSHHSYAAVSNVDFGYGMYTSYGANFSWKAIGVGYERRSGTSKYLSVDGGENGLDGKFVLSEQNRVYINFRF